MKDPWSLPALLAPPCQRWDAWCAGQCNDASTDPARSQVRRTASRRAPMCRTSSSDRRSNRLILKKLGPTPNPPPPIIRHSRCSPRRADTRQGDPPFPRPPRSPKLPTDAGTTVRHPVAPKIMQIVRRMPAERSAIPAAIAMLEPPERGQNDAPTPRLCASGGTSVRVPPYAGYAFVDLHQRITQTASPCRDEGLYSCSHTLRNSEEGRCRAKYMQL